MNNATEMAVNSSFYRFMASTPFNIRNFIRTSLQEDIGKGDHTSVACISAGTQGTARLLVKEDGIIAGVELARLIFREADKTLRMKTLKPDGSKIKRGDVVFTVQGKVRSILKTERLVLNCMQRLSGIATGTSKMVQACKGTKAKILDTRKTTPGLRALEKWAVTAGGGYNHRSGLYDMILIKDNHIDYAGGITKAVQQAKEYLERKKLPLKIEVEARDLREVKEILKCRGVDRILLDNFTPVQLKKAVQLIGGRIKTEASGGITADNIRTFARCGVDFISTGALTHSIKSLDLSLKAVP